MRYILKQDDDCHWYLLKESEEAEFDQWIEATWSNWEFYQGKDFDNNRIDHPSSISFENPRSR
jgi:hypothetical protein